MKRPPKDEYYLRVARTVASRGTCDRLRVGAVLVRNDQILSTGYNGAPSGLEHCDEVDHAMRDGHCTQAVHAEVNSLVLAARHGIRVEGAKCYCTHLPCWGCAKLLINAKISEVVYADEYRPDPRVAAAFGRVGILCRRVELSGEP